eukprot:SAG11_NODE_637_length_8033_cov_4.585707_4_plen_91_part_00
MGGGDPAERLDWRVDCARKRLVKGNVKRCHRVCLCLRPHLWRFVAANRRISSCVRHKIRPWTAGTKILVHTCTCSRLYTYMWPFGTVPHR